MACGAHSATAMTRGGILLAVMPPGRDIWADGLLVCCGLYALVYLATFLPLLRLPGLFPPPDAFERGGCDLPADNCHVAPGSRRPSRPQNHRIAGVNTSATIDETWLSPFSATRMVL